MSGSSELQMTDNLSVLIPRFSGGISSISSTLIIYIILKSNDGLSNIYHRIMFGMSLTDILGSTSVALTTLPMPAAYFDDGDDEYFHEGTKVGNVATCTAQGFFIYFGFICMFVYNGSLWVYYCCSIAIQMNEKKMKKCLEPFLHLAPIFVALGFSVGPLVRSNGYGVTNERPYCTALASNAMIYICVPLILLLALVSLFMILRKIWWVERNLPQSIQQGTTSPPPTTNDTRGGSERSDAADERRVAAVEFRRDAKVVLIQALAYLVSYLISSTVLSVLVILDLESNKPVILSHLILFPLQGFFNFMIFISHKLYSYSRSNGEYTFCDLIGMLFCQGIDEPVILTSLSLIQQDREAAHEMMIAPREPNEDDSYHSSREKDSRSGLLNFVGSRKGEEEAKNEEGDLSGFHIPSVQWSKNDLDESIESHSKVCNSSSLDDASNIKKGTDRRILEEEGRSSSLSPSSGSMSRNHDIRARYLNQDFSHSTESGGSGVKST